mgnify:CR=1 FL=1
MKFLSLSCLLCMFLGALPAVALDAFDETLELQVISFRVQCANEGSLNTLTLQTSGLTIDNSSKNFEADGVVTGAEVADLNADGSPEVYVYITSAGSGSYGSLAAWSANNRKSLSDIYLPEIAEDPELRQGYMGHDEFAVGEGTLLRRFPLYRENDVNAGPTGGTRQLQYKLEAGEAGWVLRQDRSIDF